MASIGQVDTKSTLQITTRLNRPVTGLSDVLIDIYDPSTNQLVNNAVMTEIGSTGVYQYGYLIPASQGTYTIIIVCASQRDYEELQTFHATTKPNIQGGGMVAQFPARVIDKKEEKFKKDLAKTLITIQTKLDAIIDKDSSIDLKKINRVIAQKLSLISQTNKDGNEQKKMLDSQIKKLLNQGESMKKLFVQETADFTDNIYILKENTKLLPNSLNSLLKRFEKLETNTSKFSESESNKLNNLAENIIKIQTDIKSYSEEKIEELKNYIDKVQTKTPLKEKLMGLLLSEMNITQADDFKKVISGVKKEGQENIAKMNKKIKDVSEDNELHNQMDIINQYENQP